MDLVIPVLIMYLVATECGSAIGASKHDWDILIFTQHWPNTVCMQWKEKVPEHKCILPAQHDLWTVHGIWPTKLGTIGPGYCNSSWHFDPSQLSTIEAELELQWGNVHTGPVYDLWAHEWEKHGTCAAELPALASELSYFSQGLKWVKKYDMSNILEKAGIVPASDVQTGHSALDLSTAISHALGKDPAIECLVHQKTGVVYLFEIRICFNKNLELTDCDGIKKTIDSSTVITNCPTDKAIIYPVTIPQETPVWYPTVDFQQNSHLPWLMQLLNGIHWLQWFTL